MTIIASSTSDATNAHVFVSNIPSNPRLLKYRAQSTESFGFSKPKGKTGIPRGNFFLVIFRLLTKIENGSVYDRDKYDGLISIFEKFNSTQFNNTNIFSKMQILRQDVCQKKYSGRTSVG